MKYGFYLLGLFTLGIIVICVTSFKSPVTPVEKEAIENSKKSIAPTVTTSTKVADVINAVPDNEREAEVFNNQQIFVENIDVLYEVLPYSVVSDIHEKIQNYTSNYVDATLLDCIIEKDSLKTNVDNLIFRVSYPNNKEIDVTVTGLIKQGNIYSQNNVGISFSNVVNN